MSPPRASEPDPVVDCGPHWTRRLKAAEIATGSGVPLRFLSKILGEMRDAGIVDSRRGYHGGYVLERDPHEITGGILGATSIVDIEIDGRGRSG